MADEKIGVSFVEFQPEDFPFTVQLHDEETGELLWEATVDGAGAMKVPGYHPRKVRTTVIDRNGLRAVMNSDSEDISPQPPLRQLILACIPYDVTMWSAIRQEVWHRALSSAGRAGQVFTPYPDSTPAACAECHVPVAVGPRQKQRLDKHVEDGGSALITCLLCSALMRQQGQEVGELIDLANPNDPNAGQQP